MKIKPLYIYAAVALILITLLVITANSKNNKSVTPTVTSTETMPQDETHKSLSDPTQTPPSKSNVSEKFKHQLDELKKAVDENPDDTLKVREFADFLTAAHKPDEAIIYYERILKNYPERIDILFSLSFIFYNMKDFDETEKLTKQILSIDKNNLQATYNLGALAAGRGEKNKAKEIWEKIIESNPASPVTNLAKESLQRL